MKIASFIFNLVSVLILIALCVAAFSPKEATKQEINKIESLQFDTVEFDHNQVVLLTKKGETSPKYWLIYDDPDVNIINQRVELDKASFQAIKTLLVFEHNKTSCPEREELYQAMINEILDSFRIILVSDNQQIKLEVFKK